MLRKSFKAGECKTSLKLVAARLKVLKNKKDVQVKQVRRDLAQLLEKGQEQTARIRVEQVIQEEKTMAAYDLIELYCEQIVARLWIIESQKKCPIDLKEAISSIIFAAPRCADIPELGDVRKQFSAKYGKEFVVMALEVRPDCGVSRLIVEKLSARAPETDVKNKVLAEIAKENNINWEPKAFEEKIETHQRVSDRDWERLSGPTTFASGNAMGSPSIRSQPSYERTQEPSPKARGKDDRHIPTGGNHAAGKPAESRHAEEDASLDRQQWVLNFKDATSAAQAAADSAERASLAAKAAVELASRGDFGESSSSSRKPATRARSWAASRLREDQAERDHKRASESPKIPAKESYSSEEEHPKEVPPPLRRPGKVVSIGGYSDDDDDDDDDDVVETKMGREASYSRSWSVDPEIVRDSPRQKRPVDKETENQVGHVQDPLMRFDSYESEREEQPEIDHFFGEKGSAFRDRDSNDFRMDAPKGPLSDSLSAQPVEPLPDAVVFDETSSDSDDGGIFDTVDRGRTAGSPFRVLSPKAEHPEPYSSHESGDGLKLGRLTGGLRNKGHLPPPFPPSLVVPELLPSETSTSDSPRKQAAPAPSPDLDKVKTVAGAQTKIPQRASHSRRTSLEPHESHWPAESPRAEDQSSKKSPPASTGAAPSVKTGRTSKPTAVPFFDDEEDEEEVLPPRRAIGGGGGGIRSGTVSMRTRTPFVSQVSSSTTRKPSPPPQDSPRSSRDSLPKETGRREGILPQRESSSPHVHPSLPDYERLKAHFTSLRSNHK